MKKSKSLKTVALLLSLVMIIASCVFSSGVISFADELFGGESPNGQSENSALLEMKGDYAAPNGIENYGCADVTTIDTSKNLANYSNVSVDKVGTNNSFALRIDGSDAKDALVKIGDVLNVLVPNKTYIVTMQLKKSGTVNSFNSGINIQTGLTQAQVVTDADIKEDEWTEYKFEYKPTGRRTGWGHLYLNWDIAENSSLYIDDYTIVEKSDATGHNLTPIGNFDSSLYIDGTLDNSAIENANYSKSAPEILNGLEVLKDIGYRGSYGAKLVRTQESIDNSSWNSGYFQFEDAGIFENNTEYVIEFKAKKGGNLSGLKIIFREKNQDHTVTALNASAIEEYMSSQRYVLYRFTYVTDGNASTGKSRITFSVNGTADAQLLLDDISIYAVSDAEKKSLLDKGSFDAMRIASNTDPVWETVQIPYVIEEYDCIPNYADQYHLPLNSNVAIEKAGVDDTYALKISGNGTEDGGNIKLGTAVGFLKGGTEYKVSMKVKKKGTLDTFSAHIVYNWNGSPIDLTSSVGEDWSDVSFNVTPENGEDSNNTGWNHLILRWKLPVDSELYIDDITIVAVNDEHNRNIYTKGSFDATAHEESIVDETPIVGTLYSPAHLESTPVKSTVVEYEGFKGSYALKMEGTGESTRAEVRYDSRPGLQNYTEYYIEFKAKKSGNVSYFAAGIREQWENHEALSFGNAQVVESRISDEFYNFYRIKYTTDGNALGTDGKGAWTFITFTFTADEGSYVLIDDIKVYETGKEDPKETFRKGAFDNPYYDVEFDNKEDGTTYVPRDITEYSTRHNFYVTGAKEEIDSTISIAENEGVKGSAAFKVKGSGVTNAFKISAYALNELENYSKYKLGIKVRLETEDGVTINSDRFFRFGLIERWAVNYTINFSGEKLENCITDEYHYYQTYYTTDDQCSGSWSYLIFSYNLPEGATLYIDDLELIPISEAANWITDVNNEPINLFRKSTFDMKDLGQDGANFSEDVPADIEPKVSYQYSTLSPYAVAVDDAPKGEYCMAFGFGDSELKGEHLMYITPAMPGETYRISFWVKIVGDAKGAFYVSDGTWNNHTYGADFSQYETGKWTKFELLYHDKNTPYEAVTYRRIKFEFDGAAGSGMLVDNIECVRVDCDYESFNVLGGGKGDFETTEIYPEIAWEDNTRFVYKEGE